MEMFQSYLHGIMILLTFYFEPITILFEKIIVHTRNQFFFFTYNEFENIISLRVEPKVNFKKYFGYSKNSSGRSELNSLYVIRVLVNKKSD